MEEAISNSNQIENSRENFQEILELIRDMMGELHHSASIGADLNSLNISNEWAEGIKEFFNSPVKTSFEAFQALQNSINQMIQAQFEDFLITKKELIDKVFLISNNKLHYAIILKEDTIEHEAEVLEFKLNYDETPIAKKFPLIISFPEYGHLEGARLETELTLG